MSNELLAVLITVTAAYFSVLLVVALAILVLVYRMSRKQEAGDAAIYLQGQRIQSVLREMRESLRQ
jgi:hypothetical protein